MKSGIYKIVCLPTGKVYIGQSKDVRSRFKYHLYDLKRGKHGNPYFMRAYEKYGKNAFQFEVLEYCEIEKLDEREIYYIATYRSCEEEFGYNILNSPWWRDAIKSRWNDPEFKNKMCEKHQSNWEDPEFRERNVKAIKKAHDERKSRGELLAIHTPEAIEKARERQKENWKKQEYRQEITDKIKKTTNDEDFKKARAADAKRGWKKGVRAGVIKHNEMQKNDVEYKKRQAEKARLGWIKRREKFKI